MSISSRQKYRFGLMIAFIVIGYFAKQFSSNETPPSSKSNVNIEQLIQQQKSDVQVAVTSQVFKILKDDVEGSQHQRFLIQISSGQTILIAHNIDLAPRVDGLKKGDMVTVYGEYEWNKKGGVIHWTHHDPGKRHIDGWIEHNGNRYQ